MNAMSNTLSAAEPVEAERPVAEPAAEAMESEAEANAPPPDREIDEIAQAHARAQALRTLEAVLFAAPEPMDAKALAKRLPPGSDIEALATELEAHYANRGVHFVRVAGKFALRTAPDLTSALQIEQVVTRKLSRAAIETMSIIAYHQPVTRAEIEEIRGVALSRGTLDTLMEAGWIQPKGHRETPGHPATWVTTEAFLSHFGLNSTKDLPGIEELKAAGLLDARPGVSAYGDEGKLGEVEPAAEDDEARMVLDSEPEAAPEKPAEDAEAGPRPA